MKRLMKRLKDLPPGTIVRIFGNQTKYDDRYRVGTKYYDNKIAARNMRTKEAFLFPGNLLVIKSKE